MKFLYFFLLGLCVLICETHEITDTVFLDISIDNKRVGRIELGLFGGVAPKTVKNFIALCNGSYGVGKKGKLLSYKNSIVHRIIPNFMMQGGDFETGKGYGGESIYGPKFEDESFIVRHDRKGILSMANSGRDSNGSQFFITTVKTPWLDGHHVAFGQVTEGMNVLSAVDACGTSSGKPQCIVTIADCGVIEESIKDDEEKTEKDEGDETNDDQHEEKTHDGKQEDSEIVDDENASEDKVYEDNNASEEKNEEKEGDDADEENNDENKTEDDEKTYQNDNDSEDENRKQNKHLRSDDETE